jgi:aromatic ring-opening dioxygenase LigB subunit
MILALFVFALSTTRNVFCWARLDAVVLLPHGSEALEPSLLPDQTPERAAAEEIAAAAARAGHWLSEIVNPDLIFLSTQHGITLQRNFGIYIGKYASGSVTLSPEEEESEQENWHNNNNNNSNTSTRTIIRHLDPVKIAENRSIHIVRELGDEKHWNVEGIQTSPLDSNDVPLQYGSIIPLLMLQQSPPPSSQSTNTTPIARAVATTTRPRLLRGHAKQRLERLHVFFSHPNRRHVEDTTDKMMSELLQLGHWLRTWMDIHQADLRIAVIISGDLSHTHDWRNGPYGYSPAAVPMDAALGRWAFNPFRHAHDLLVEARSLQPQAPPPPPTTRRLQSPRIVQQRLLLQQHKKKKKKKKTTLMLQFS